MSEITMNESHEDAPEDAGRKLTGWHVLMIMLGFFGVIFAVNGVFLYNAINSFPGEDTKKSYLQGLNYNQTLAERTAQAELGWTAAAGVAGSELIFALNDAEGAALSSRRVVAQIRRAASKSGDVELILTYQGEGEYAGDISGLEAGRWDVRISVLDMTSEDVVFRADKTVTVK